MTTCPVDHADTLAECLVQARLAACVQVVAPIRSVYRWDGAVQRDAEALLLIKTPTDRLTDAERALRAAHPYEVPEWLVVPALAVGSDYLAWAREQTAQR